MDDVQVLTIVYHVLAIGDYCFKLPACYTERIFLNANSGFNRPNAVREYISRNITPPYISNQADVHHVDLKLGGREHFLILCSDGFVDLYMRDAARAKPLALIADGWVSLIGSLSDENNQALLLLRDALGGEDDDKVSRNLMRKATERWLDDVTILVVRL
jgi:pyruvate dehydrogenase phosphatase